MGKPLITDLSESLKQEIELNPASSISIADTAEHFTATDVEGALSELFQSVSDGKGEIATAITDKGGTADGGDTFTELANAITDLPSGGSGSSYSMFEDSSNSCYIGFVAFSSTIDIPI